MSLYREHQANPSDPYQEPTEIERRISGAVKSLEDHRRPIVRWFWRGIFALNCVLASGTLWVIVLRYA